MLKHFVVTRLGLGVYSVPWYESTLGLFEAITYPSLRAQTSQEFTSLIVVDQQMPEPALRRLRATVGGTKNFHIVPLDLTNLRHVRHGCFDHVWDRCLDYIIEQRLLTDPSEYILTSHLDADDAWRRDVVELANEQSMSEPARLSANESGRSAIVRHTCGQVLTFPLGLRWFAQPDIVQPFHHEFLGMAVFVLARASGGISVLSSRHSAWPAMAHALMFEVKQAQIDCPMWVYVRHNRSQIDWKIEVATSDPASAESLRGQFGIDFARIEAWRANDAMRSAKGEPLRHPGLSSREQHDCFFRLAALNRQIALLKRKERENGLDDDDELLLLQQREARLKLLERLHEQGHQIFQ